MQELNRGFTSLQEPNLEEKLRNVLKSGRYHVSNLETAVSEAEIIFVAVPTPSKDDKSFKTTFVKDAVRDIVYNIRPNDNYKTIAVISTVLPTTIRSEVVPIIEEGKQKGKNVQVCYNAYFIAMSTVIADWLDPEFVLIGEGDDKLAGNQLECFYRTIVPKETPIFRMTYEEAELTKMSYNCYVGAKIVIANTIMEFCDRIPHADCDVVSNALSHATRRIVGKNYMRGGMGDGGNCHGRDNDALSWCSDKLDLSTNPFKYVMDARYAQTKFLANLVKFKRDEHNLPVVILGKRFKWNSNLTDYSPSLLLSDILHAKGVSHTIYDPLLDGEKSFKDPTLFVVTLTDETFQDFPFPKGSVVIDVWRFLKEKEGITYYKVGGRKD